MFGRLSGTGAAAEDDGKESQLGQRESQLTGRRSGVGHTNYKVL